MIAAGTQLGPYEIVSQLGAGGMGEVYRSRDTQLDRAIAFQVGNKAKLGATVKSDEARTMGASGEALSGGSGA
jgi:hypothetical protein